MSHFDLIVVGAGMVGACVAFQARVRFPTWKILLVDRSFVADGVTRYSGGLNHPYGWSEEQAALSRESLRLFDEISRTIPGLPLFNTPLFGLASQRQADSMLLRFTRPGARIGSSQDLAALQATYPDLTVPPGQVLLVGCMGGFGDPPVIARMIARWLRDQPRTVCWEGVEVVDVRHRANAPEVITSDGRCLHASYAVIAAGPWMVRGLGRETFSAAGVRIKKIVSLHVDRRPAVGDAVLFFFDDDAYLLPHHAQQYWLFSFPAREWNCAPDISNLRITAEDRKHAMDILRAYCPSLENECHTGRVFCDAYSPDRLPVIANAFDTNRCVVAGACSGFGFRLAPAIARRALSALMTEPL